MIGLTYIFQMKVYDHRPQMFTYVNTSISEKIESPTLKVKAHLLVITF